MPKSVRRTTVQLICWFIFILSLQLAIRPVSVFADPPPAEQFEINGQPVTAVPQLQQSTIVTPTLQAIITPTLTLSEPEIQPGEIVTLTVKLTNVGTAVAQPYHMTLYLGNELTPLPDASLTSGTEANLYTLASNQIAPGAFQEWAFPLQLATTANSYQAAYLYGFAPDTVLPQPIRTMTTLLVTGGALPLAPQTVEDKGWLPRFTAPTASLFSGAASYGYALDAVPGRRGLQPQLSLNYNSRSTDGMAGTFAAHSGAYGEGWEMSGIPSIVRNNVDHCWPGDSNQTICVVNSFSLVFGGSSYQLVKTGQQEEYGVYQAMGDPTLYVERRNYLADNGSPDNVTGEYWVVRSADGTEYRLGYKGDAEQVLAVTDLAVYTGLVPKIAVYRWWLDQAKDVYGNGMVITYKDKDAFDVGDNRLLASGFWGCVAAVCREVATYPDNIYYNNQTAGVMDNWLSTVEFSYISSQYVPVQNGAPIFATMLRLGSVAMKHNGQKVWDYAFDYTLFATHGNNARIVSLAYVQQRHYDNSGNLITPNPLPPTTFEYQMFNNGYDIEYPRLKVLRNGYGGVYELTYAQIDHGGARSHYITDIKGWDDVQQLYPGTPTVHFDYDYNPAHACFDTWEPLPGCNTGPGDASEKLVGFSTALLKIKDGSGTILSYTVTNFHIGNDVLWLGKEQWTGTYHPNGVTLLSETSKTWSNIDNNNNCWNYGLWFDYVCLVEERNIVNYYSNPIKTLETWQRYYHEYAGQGNRQWGKVTRADNFYTNLNGEAVLENRQITSYRTNTTNWIIVPWVTSTRHPDWSAAQNTFYLYDNQTDPDDQVISIGKLTMMRVPLLQDLDPGNNVQYDTIDTTFVYDSYGNQTGVTTYEDYGRIGYTAVGNWDINGAAGNGSTAVTHNTVYMNHGLQVQYQRNPLYPTFPQTSFGYHSRFYWLPTSVTDANGRVTSYEYDHAARLTKVARPGDTLANPTTQYVYTLNTTPFKVEAILQPNNAPLRQETEQFYNGLGQLIQTSQVGANVDGAGVRDLVTLAGYDALGRQTCQSVVYDMAHNSGYQTGAACTAQPHTATHYSERGRVNQVTYPDNTATTITYRIPGNWSGMVGRGLQQDYIVNAKNDVTVNSYDAFGRLDWVGQKDDGGPCSALHVTLYDYNTVGNLEQVTRGGQVCGDNYTPGTVLTTMTYDGAGRKTSMTDPDMGYWTYKYDPAGSLVRQIANPGDEQQILCFEYDALNRLEQKGVGDTSDSCNINETLASYEYDPANGIGQLHTVSWGPDPTSNRDEFFYDNLGRMDKQSCWLDGTRYDVLTTGFDGLHRPLTMQYPDGETITLTYDREGENSLKLGASTFLVDNITYNVRGQMMTLSRPSPLLDTTFSYYLATGTDGNSNFRLQTIQHGTGSDALPDFTYQYDPVGNITNLATAVSGSTEHQHFAYDHLNRLDIACTWNSSACTPEPDLAQNQYSHNYNYDLLGNIHQRMEKVGNTLNTYTYDYGDQPHAVTSVTQGTEIQTFTYDDNGNMETRNDESGNFQQVFDIENRLIKVTNNDTNAVTQFFYDASGQRVKTIQPDETVIYSPFPNYDEEHRDASLGRDGST
ncbi:MAG TPA: SpvB/TcaC N-terminal domain-containing protein [Chloroflexota bacterium]|nr:SpvB/TcaC N-terminal domain-containing protein [Chloroflexota bacterium]